MSNPLHTLLVAGLLVIGLSAAAQTTVPVSATSIPSSPDGAFSFFVPITKYLAKGDAASLSSWFADTLDVTVISSTRNCSRRQAQEILRLKDALCDILAKHTGRPAKDIRRQSDRDFFMSAEEAIANGLVDKVLVPKN